MFNLDTSYGAVSDLKVDYADRALIDNRDRLCQSLLEILLNALVIALRSFLWPLDRCCVDWMKFRPVSASNGDWWSWTESFKVDLQVDGNLCGTSAAVFSSPDFDGGQ